LKRKYFFVVLFLVLVMFLVGCSGGGIVTPATDEAKVKSVIQQYSLALNDQNWSKAKSYCVYGSDAYYSVCVKEDAVQVLYQYCNVVSLTYFVDIINVDINGNYADAYVNVHSVITACGYAENNNINQTAYLQKIGNNWKLYGAVEPSTPAIPSYWGKLYNSTDGNCVSSGEALDFYIDGVFHATINSGKNLSVKLTEGEHTFKVLLTKTQEVLLSGYKHEIVQEDWWFSYGCDDGTYPKDIEYKNTENNVNSSHSGQLNKNILLKNE